MVNETKERKIHISEKDRERLTELLREERRASRRGPEYLADLEAELNRAEVLAPEDVPENVVTMNSRVRLVDEDTGEEMVYTLVFPNEADVSEGKVSVLAPVGTAILGYSAGDTLEWQVPGGLRRLHVREVLYQPEAAGDYES